MRDDWYMELLNLVYFYKIFLNFNDYQFKNKMKKWILMLNLFLLLNTDT